MMPVSVLLPVFVPVRVSVRAPVPLITSLPTLVRVKAPLPEASIDPPDIPSENNRSVLTAAPVYWRVPPFIIRLAATLVDAPKLLLIPPLASELTLNTPVLMVLTPVYVLTPERVSVPVPTLVSDVFFVPTWMTPLNVVEVLSPPAVKVAFVPPVLVTTPEPLRLPIVSLKAKRSNVPAEAIVTALPSGMTPAAPNCKTPALTVVAPP